MTAPLIGDSSDRVIELSRGVRVQGWAVPEWIAFLGRHPDATLPAGVGGAIVQHFTRAGLVTVDLLSGENVRHSCNTPDAYACVRCRVVVWEAHHDCFPLCLKCAYP